MKSKGYAGYPPQLGVELQEHRCAATAAGNFNSREAGHNASPRRRLRFGYFIALVLAFLLALPPLSAAAEIRRLVLVTSAESNIPPLAPLEVQRVFLGVPVVKEGRSISGVRNLTDPLLYEVFLQNVIFMSSRTYERRLLANVFESGAPRPRASNTISDLVRTLDEQPDSVTYMWASTAEGTRGLKIVRELWQGRTD